MYFPESLVVIIGTGLPTFLVVQLWQLACCHRLVGVTTCFRAITTNPLVEAAQMTVMFFRDLASTLPLQLSVSDLLGGTGGGGESETILNGDNMLLSTTLRVLAPWALMVAKPMSLAETLGKRLIKLALTTYTMGNVFWVISSNRYCAADQLWGLA